MSGGSARTSYCFLLLLVGAVLGLDILPTALTWASPHLHPYSEKEWWHQDRTTSFLGGVLYAPHHMAGFCSLLKPSWCSSSPSGATTTPRTHRPALSRPPPWPKSPSPPPVTALFPTSLYVFVLGFWAIDLLRRRQFAVVGALAGAGILAVLLAHPYLRELSTGSSAASGFVSLRWRNDAFLSGYHPASTPLRTQPASSAFSPGSRLCSSSTSSTSASTPSS